MVDPNPNFYPSCIKLGYDNSLGIFKTDSKPTLE